MKGNTVSIKGNITRDAEVRHTNSGRIVASWGIAWTKTRKTESGFEDVPFYFEVQAWLTDKQLRALEPMLVKGAKCAIIDGHLEYQAWEANGQKRSKVLIQVDDPISGLLVSPPATEQPKREEPLYEDIPF